MNRLASIPFIAIAALVFAGCSSSSSNGPATTGSAAAHQSGDAESTDGAAASTAAPASARSSSSATVSASATSGKVPDGATAVQIAKLLACTKSFSTNPTAAGGVKPASVEGCTFMGQPIGIEAWHSVTDQKTYLKFFATALDKSHGTFYQAVGDNGWDVALDVSATPTAKTIAQSKTLAGEVVAQLGGSVVKIG